MKSVLVFAHVDVPAPGRPTPGAGARPYEMALALARAGSRVTLAAPNAKEVVGLPGVTVVAADLRTPLEGHDAYVLPSAWFSGRQERPRGLVVGDAADPMLLSYALREEDTPEGRIAFEGRIHSMARCLSESDVLLHSGPGGGRYLIGMLALLGRIAPGRPEPGDDLLDVPFAAPPLHAPPTTPATSPVLLWSSGIYPFFDAARALAVFEACAGSLGNLRFDVAGGSIVGGHTSDGAAYREFKSAVEASVFRTRVRFLPFVPYAERAAVYAEATLSLVFTRPGVEDALAWRNRVVDSLWAGLPLVVDGDDDLTRMAVAAGAAVRVERTVDAGTAAVRELLTDPLRRARMREAGRKLAGGALAWDAVIRPLLARIEGGAVRPGLAPGGGSPLRLSPRRWGSLLHRLQVSFRLRGPAGFLGNAAGRIFGK